MIKICNYCNDQFTTKSKTSKSCSVRCSNLSRNRGTRQATCQNCQIIFKPKSGSTGKYCTQSCAAKKNNVISVKRSKTNKCQCGQFILSTHKYCSICIIDARRINGTKAISNLIPGSKQNANLLRQKNLCPICKIEISKQAQACQLCRTIIYKHRRIQQWLSGEWLGGTNYGLSKTIRDYLLKEAQYKCSKCGFDKTHPDDNKTILEINHIDGNGTNHSPDNLEVICPNCHALTSSYRGRNQGNGRPYSYIRKFKARLV